MVKKDISKKPVAVTSSLHQRWEHAFAADFGPNWHLAYTSDENVRSVQRARWVKQLMGIESTDPEEKARAHFDYNSFMQFYKSQFMIFENLLKSVIPPGSGNGCPITTRKDETEEVKIEYPESSTSENCGYIMLNGSIKIKVLKDRPFVIGSSQTSNLNDLGDDLGAPDLNLKHLTRNPVNKRHCVINFKNGWTLAVKGPVIVDGNEASSGTQKLRNNSTVVVANEIIVKFFC
jgi:hypothetical protein